MHRNFIYPVLIIAAFGLLAFSSFKNLKKINCTELNGTGCVCHGLDSSNRMTVWCTGPSVLEAGTTARYKMFMTGGPAIGGGYNVAVRFGIMDSIDDLSDLIDNELTQSRPLIFRSTTDTLFWEFKITAPDTAVIDTLYSCGLSTNNDHAPDIGDEWKFGRKFPIRVIPKVVPVELELLSLVTLPDGRQQISIKTRSEKNNRGFIIEQLLNTAWKQVGFVAGKGTSTEPENYLYTLSPSVNSSSYRVKQVDYSGKETILGTVNAAGSTSLKTEIFPSVATDKINCMLSLTDASVVNIVIYSVSGEKMVSQNTSVSAGMHTVPVSLKSLPTGVYLIEITAGTKRYVSKFIKAK